MRLRQRPVRQESSRRSRTNFLPTNHGFDEFFGNLYHLNAEEEPENPDYPKDPNFRRRFGPRGVIRSSAGREKVEDTGPLTKKRMETIDDEFLRRGPRFHGSPAPGRTSRCSCWFNSTRMHVNTHLKPEVDGKTGKGVYPDGMVEHDGHVGQLLKKLDDLGVTRRTPSSLYTTDNGAEVMTVAGRRHDAVPRRKGQRHGKADTACRR